MQVRFQFLNFFFEKLQVAVNCWSKLSISEGGHLYNKVLDALMYMVITDNMPLIHVKNLATNSTLHRRRLSLSHLVELLLR